MCDGYAMSSDGITVNGNTFTGCDRAMDGYYSGMPDGTAGALTFANNTVTGSSALRSKIVVMEQSSRGTIGAVRVTGNTFNYTMVLMENIVESSCTVNDILADNTLGTSSYYVEGDGWYYSGSYHGSITVNLLDAAYYEVPEGGTGYWVLNIGLDELINNSESATAYVQVASDFHALSGWMQAKLSCFGLSPLLRTASTGVSGTMPSEKVSEPGLDKVVATDEGESEKDNVTVGDTVD